MEEVQDVVKPIVQIRGANGDLYMLIGAVSIVLANESSSRAEEFVHRAIPLGTYDEVLRLSQDYVDFE